MPDYSSHHVDAGRIGGLVRAARATDPGALGRSGQRGLMARFEREVPAEVTDPVQRANQAQLALRAHMARLAMKSRQKRAKPGMSRSAA